MKANLTGHNFPICTTPTYRERTCSACSFLGSITSEVPGRFYDVYSCDGTAEQIGEALIIQFGPEDQDYWCYRQSEAENSLKAFSDYPDTELYIHPDTELYIALRKGHAMMLFYGIWRLK